MTELLEAGDFSVDVEARTVRGLLMPWGEKSRKSVTSDPLMFDRGALKVPADISALNANRNHDRHDPIGRFTAVEDTDRGLVAEFAISRNPEGDEFLEQYQTGKLKKLSAEVRNIVRTGLKATAVLTGAAFVPEGAFASAGLFAIDETPEERVERLKAELQEAEAAVAVTEAPSKASADEVTQPELPVQNKEDEVSPVNQVSPTLADANSANATAPTKNEMFALFNKFSRGEIGQEVVSAKLQEAGSTTALFALSDVKYSGTGSIQPDARAPQWLGELYAGRAYQQTVVPLFNHGDLTSRTVAGFRWGVKPAGGTFAGNKSNVPSNVPTTSQYNTTAKMWAGGHDHAIEFRLFNVPGYWESYFQAMTEDYARWVDQTVVLTDVLAGSTSIEADNPAGLSIGSGMSALIDGAAAVIAGNDVPTFAILAPDVWKLIAKTPSKDTLGYLSAALGLEEGQLANFRLVSSPLVPAGNILVGARAAVRVLELPGTPLRLQGYDFARGGVDTLLVGAAAVVIEKASALQLVTPYTA